MKKKILLLLIGLALAICFVTALAACEDGTDPNPEEQNPAEVECVHDWSDATCILPKTCSKCLATEGTVAEHSYANGVCTVCGAEEPNECVHDWSNATCTAPKTCNKCGETEGTVTGHNYVDGTCTACGNPDPKAEYTVNLSTIGGLLLEGTAIQVYNESGKAVGGSKTDSMGNVTFTLDKTHSYTVKTVAELLGYNFNENGYAIEPGLTEIVLTPSVIPSDKESDYAGKSYELGDVMYDFTLTTIKGETVRLSELLTTGGKKGVLLNFWYVDCNNCQAEFPFIQSVYEEFSDQIAIIAINPIEKETLEYVESYVSEAGITFDIVKGGLTLDSAFSKVGYPLSVFIDRYGTITFIENGSLPYELPFRELFSKAVAEDYTQVIYESLDELCPPIIPNVEMPPSEDIKNVLNPELDITYRAEENSDDAELSWPFIIVEKNGVQCIKPANSGIDSSYAMIHADVYLSAGQALVFDYWSSTEEGADILYVIVDGVDILAISGDSKEDGAETGWKTACAYVAVEDGTYKVSFIYWKDYSDQYSDDDCVFIKNFNVINSEELDTPAYIQRECATDPDEWSGIYTNYVEIFYNEEDGYYHVGSSTGPILLADLMAYTLFSSENSIYGYAIYDELILDGTNYYNSLLKYFTYSSNSDLYGLCPVNEELMELLKIVAKIVGNGNKNPNDWLEICKYYDAYATGGVQLADPIKGLAPHSAFDAIVNTESDPEDYYPNVVVYEKLIMPRGLLYEFIPSQSGVYLIKTRGDDALLGWVFDENHEIIKEYELLERFFVNSDDELYTDTYNVYLYMYFEAGQKYYVDVAFSYTNQLGLIEFKIEYIGETHTIFAAASPGYYTFNVDETTGELLPGLKAGGIDVMYCEEDGYYHHAISASDGKCDNCGADMLDENVTGCIAHEDLKTPGSIVYADFTLTTNLFTNAPIWTPEENQNVTTLISAGYFDFTMSEEDEVAIAEGWDKMTDEELQDLWGEDFESNYKQYHIEDLRKDTPVYHGFGGDYTETILRYIEEEMIRDNDDRNLNGCVAVDKELATILQMLAETRGFKDVPNAWTKLCYYYLEIGPNSI